MISVVVVSFNTKELLKNCLTSLEEHLPKVAAEIIVVDNNSRDGSAEMVEKYFPEVRLICTEENIGFGSANNVGMRLAKGDIFWLLNSDAQVLASPGPVLKFMEDTGATLVGVQLVEFGGKLQKYTCGSFFNLLSPIKKLLPTFTPPWEREDPVEVDWVSGASMFLKREISEAIGGFDEAYFMYFEDQDFCYRAKQAGFRVYYNPKYAVVHGSGSSFRGDRKAAKKLYYRSMRRFFMKTRPRWEGAVLEVALYFWEKFLRFLKSGKMVR